MSDRIESIRQLLAKDPDDIFLHYSLGMECATAQRCDEAIRAFEQCLRLEAGYLPAIVEAGKCSRSAGRIDEARAWFEKALALAKDQGNEHAQDAIRQQIDGLGAEE